MWDWVWQIQKALWGEMDYYLLLCMVQGTKDTEKQTKILEAHFLGRVL
jgi:hypothetical protein